MPKKGPHVAAAFACQQVLHENDGVLSAIRIVDRYTIHGSLELLTAAGHLKDIAIPPPPLPLTILLCLKSGDFVGSYEVELVLHTPSGKKQKVASSTMTLNGQGHGNNLIVSVGIESPE